MKRAILARTAGAVAGVLLALLALVVLDVVRPRPAPPASTVVVDRSDVHDRLLAERRAHPERRTASLGLLEDSVLAREVIPESAARRLYPGFGPATVWDRHTVFAHAPHILRRRPWPEHPDGGWWVRTDALGMREDAPPDEQTPPLRVLVLGDSHTDGVCPNPESFANRLEGLLAERPGLDGAEVLNGGTGGWCAYNYLGAVEKWRALDPDLVVVALYGGNDLVEATLYRHYFERTERTPQVRALALRMAEVAQAYPEASSQVLSQTAYLTWTGAVEQTVATTVRVLDELERTCARIGSETLIAYLPAPSQVELARHRAALEPGLAALELEFSDLAQLDAARDRLLEELRALGIATLDLTPPLRAAAAAERTYWERDLHLGLAGHRAVAAALAARIASGPAGVDLGR